jgi:hypothetical protein
MSSEQRIGLHHANQLDAADVRQLDVHDHELRQEDADGVERLARVTDRPDLGAMRFEQIAEEPEVQLIILDNQDFFRHGNHI